MRQGQVKPGSICSAEYFLILIHSSSIFSVFTYLKQPERQYPRWVVPSMGRMWGCGLRGVGRAHGHMVAWSPGTWMQSAVRDQQIAGVSQAALIVPLSGSRRNAAMCAIVFLQQIAGHEFVKCVPRNHMDDSWSREIFEDYFCYTFCCKLRLWLVKRIHFSRWTSKIRIKL